MAWLVKPLLRSLHDLNEGRIFAGWSPYRRLDLPGSDAEGQSDLLLGTKHRFLDETKDRPSAAFQLAAKLPIASSKEGSSAGEVAGPDTDVEQTIVLAAGTPVNETP